MKALKKLYKDSEYLENFKNIVNEYSKNINIMKDEINQYLNNLGDFSSDIIDINKTIKLSSYSSNKYSIDLKNIKNDINNKDKYTTKIYELTIDEPQFDYKVMKQLLDKYNNKDSNDLIAIVSQYTIKFKFINITLAMDYYRQLMIKYTNALSTYYHYGPLSLLKIYNTCRSIVNKANKVIDTE